MLADLHLSAHERNLSPDTRPQTYEQNKKGFTPVHAAASLGKTEMVRFMVRTLKADEMTRDNEVGGRKGVLMVI